MGVVFFCLALLYLCFWILGKIMNHTDNVHDLVNLDKKEHIKLDISRVRAAHAEDAAAAGEAQPAAEETAEEKAEDEIPGEIAAVIAQAIQDYQDDVHVEESGIITLIPRESRWR